MSHEDDLYGDLYGTDDVQEVEEKPEVKAPTPEPEQKPAVTPSAAPASKPIPTVSTSNSYNQQDSSENVAQPIPTYIDSRSGGQNATPYSAQVVNKFNQSATSNSASDNSKDVSRSNAANIMPPPAPIPTSTSFDNDANADGVRPSDMKDEGKMFVGGLNWDTTDDGLRNYFSQFGKVDACTIMRDPAGRSRGFAFLTFEDPAAVNAVMVREHYLDGKIIDPKRAIPRTEHQRTIKMFVGGLPPSVNTERMKEYFSQFGRVIDATVMVDRDSSRSKGFGFVTFDDQSNAERLFTMPGLEIDGKMIEVKVAQPRAGQNMNNNMGNQNNNTRYNNYSGGSGGGGGGGGNGAGTPF